jgi:hypothetical protein
MDILIAIIIAVVVASLYLYITGKMYLRETFSAEPATPSGAGYKEAPEGAEKATLKSFQQKVKKPSNEVIIGEAGEVVAFDEANVEKPYMTNQHLYGDYEDQSYEGDFIFAQEGGPNASRDAINAARRRFPYDWANLPPSANQFQLQQMLFSKEPVAQAASYTAETFKDIEAADLLPPDSVAEAERQAKLLASYKPISAKDFGAPTTQSVEDLVAKIYEPRGLIPMVKQKGDTNVYEIYETKEVNPKIVYEDEPSQQRGVANPLEPLSPNVEKYVNMPTDSSLGLAPVSEKTKMGRNSYATYDPQLETMFGPRMTWQQWG